MLLEEQGILPLGSWTRYEYGLAYCIISSTYLLLLQVGKDSLSREGGASVVVCDINKSMLQVSWLMFPKLAWDGNTTIILQTSPNNHEGWWISSSEFGSHLWHILGWRRCSGKTKFVLGIHQKLFFSRNCLFLTRPLTATLWLLGSGTYLQIMVKLIEKWNRNVVRVEEALAEAYRVLKPGGRWLMKWCLCFPIKCVGSCVWSSVKWLPLG